jgi:hypothetical protein
LTLILKKVQSDNSVPWTIKQNDVWVNLVTEFIKLVPPTGCKSILTIPPSILHCCRLSVEVKHKRNLLSRTQKKTIPGCVTTLNHVQTNNDGLLHYAPYQVVIVPSTKFYETLCVAEQGRKGDPDHQHPVYHSVIPNHMARDYEDKNIFPSGCINDVVIADQYFFVPVEIPFDEGQPTVDFMIRRVLIRYSKDYKKPPKNGSCCLSNQDYFESCTRIFGPEWENNDIKNNVDACLITGEPGRNDKGRNEILLAGRIYRKGFEIPTADNPSKYV